MKPFRPYQGEKDAVLMTRLMVQDIAGSVDRRTFGDYLKGILKKANSRNTLIMESCGYIRIFNDHEFGFLRFDLEKTKRSGIAACALKEKLKEVCHRSRKNLRIMLRDDKGWKHVLVKQLGFSPIRYFFEMERTRIEKQWDMIDFHAERLVLEPYSPKLDIRDFNRCFNAVYADSFEHEPASVKEWKEDIAEGELNGNTFFVLKNNTNKTVGFLILSHYLHHQQGHKYGFIEEIGVIDAYRGRGIGTRLLKYGVGCLQSDYKQRHVRLHVDGENRYKALEIYKKEGFSVKSMNIEYQYRAK
ncbi:MAG: N-acetyltransferase [bacterium]|nr:N-acetyltransferase [bacterium]